MDGFIGGLGQFISDNQVWAGPIVGLIAFGESLAVVGMLIPATAIMLAIGGLIGAGIIDPVPVLIGAVIGAVIGDILSYFLGWWLGRRVIHQWPLNKYRSHIAQARLMFRKYGFAAVFFGRFFGPVRCTVPLVAGMMSMDQKRFQTANVTSAIVWAPVMIAPGWLAGRGAGMFSHLGGSGWIWMAVGLTVVATIASIVGIRMMRARPKHERKRGAGKNKVSATPAE